MTYFQPVSFLFTCCDSNNPIIPKEDYHNSDYFYQVQIMIGRYKYSEELSLLYLSYDYLCDHDIYYNVLDGISQDKIVDMINHIHDTFRSTINSKILDRGTVYFGTIYTDWGKSIATETNYRAIKNIELDKDIIEDIIKKHLYGSVSSINIEMIEKHTDLFLYNTNAVRKLESDYYKLVKDYPNILVV
jgi:hypothetical protein